MSLLRPLTRLASHPIALILAGLFLSASSAVELGESLISLEEGVKGEHGSFMFGIMSLLKGLGDLGEIDEGVHLVDEKSGELRSGRTEA